METLPFFTQNCRSTFQPVVELLHLEIITWRLDHLRRRQAVNLHIRHLDLTVEQVLQQTECADDRGIGLDKKLFKLLVTDTRRQRRHTRWTTGVTFAFGQDLAAELENFSELLAHLLGIADTALDPTEAAADTVRILSSM